MSDNGITDVFFDLDHTLWDFEKNSAITFNKILSRNDIDIELNSFLKIYLPANESFWKRYREGKITKEQLRYQRLRSVFDTLEYPISDTAIGALSDDYIQYLSLSKHLFPNTLEVLEYLRPKYTLHIITNGFKEVQDKKLRNTNLKGYFDQVVDSETAGVKKPDLRIFEFALDRAGARAENSMMIGDNLEADIQGALNAGFHTIHFNSHNDPLHELCPMIHDLDEIKTYL